MIAELGRFALALAFILSLAQAGLALRAAFGGAELWASAARRAGVLILFALLAAFICLVTAFVQSDFSVENVWMNSHTAKPLGYKIAGAWGSHEGSMILWCLGLSAYGAAMAWGYRGVLASRAMAVAAGILSLFLAFTLFASNPFDRLNPVPLEGRGLNPLLQDPALAVHPPMLYLGLTGLLAPFALAVAALWSGRPAQDWAGAARNWTLAAFAALTVGISLGSYWAYYELGWGGWWFWDPVENASLMPWLLTAALLHSLVVTARRGALAGWSLFLSLSAFSLAILGLFLTRSGVLTSVHAFALDPRRGLLLLAILGVAAGGGFLLYGWRAAKLFNTGTRFEPVSREGALILNNALLTVVAAIVLTGTLYPLLARSAAGETVAVGAPYFEISTGPIMALALLVLPLGPFLRWRGGGLKELRQRLSFSAIGLVAALFGAFLLWRGAPIGAAVAAALAVWVIAGALADLLAWRTQPGVWGRVLAHGGVGLLLLGAAMDSGFAVERQSALVEGAEMQALGGTFQLQDVRRADGANYLSDEGVIAVRQGGKAFTMRPERRFFPVAEQTTTEVAIDRRLSGDLYVALGEPRPGEGEEIAWVVRVSHHPLIWTVFAGAAMIALGGIVALVSRLRRERRLERPA